MTTFDLTNSFTIRTLLAYQALLGIALYLLNFPLLRMAIYLGLALAGVGIVTMEKR